MYSKVNQLYIYIYPLFFGFLSHLGHHRALSRVPCAIPSHYLPILYIASIVYICQSPSPSSSHPSLPPWYPYVCSLCLCLYFCFANKTIYTISFRFHIYALVYDICFSLSDLLHSVWQSLGPSMSLQMIQFQSFQWLSNIPLYICTTSSLSIPLLIDI